MHPIHFYRNPKGEQPVYDYIKDLSKRNDKDSRIKLSKIQDYIKMLRTVGKAAGLPYLRRVKDEIWELRPLRDRIMFVTWHDDGFVLLHTFMKATQKTPRREIEKAEREWKDLLERGDFL